MRTKSIWFVALLLLSTLPMKTHAQSYDRLWKEVDTAVVKGLPKTVIKHTEDIFRKAEQEKNTAQMLKAYTVRSEYRQQISPDSFYVDLKGMETWATTAASQEDRAVLHTLIARLYSDYASQNQWELRNRTDVLDTPSEDIREWSSNMFVQKVLDHTRAARQDTKKMSEISSRAYIPFVKQGDWSRHYNHNMAQLLADYNIRSLRNMRKFEENSVFKQTIDSVYSELRTLYQEQKNTNALLLLSIDNLKWRYEEDQLFTEEYLSALDQLIAEYADSELAAEPYLYKAAELKKQANPQEALQVCEEAIRKYPRYQRINAVKNLKEDILRPSLTIAEQGKAYPGDSIPLRVSHKNLNGFTIHFYRVNLPANSPILMNQGINEEFYKKYTTKIDSRHVPLIRTTDYLSQDTVCQIVAPQEGVYVMKIISDDKSGDSSARKLYVSSLKILSRRLPDSQFEVVVMDAKSGKPVSGANVHLYKDVRGEAKPEQAFTTDGDGRLTTPWKESYTYISADEGGKKSTPIYRTRSYYYRFSEERTETVQVNLLTDRSLYRPGQIVHVKGIAYNYRFEDSNVIKDKNFTLTLTDPNGREVGKQEVYTNDFGSFTAQFTLPSGGLNGYYYLTTEAGQSVIRVEEYKRPTFEITFEPQTDTYRLGDSVELKGSVKTYSGVPLQELPVEYTVTRNVRRWWGGYFGRSTLIASGTAMLNDAGEFTLPVELTPDEESKNEAIFYTYTISATATGLSGETQSATTSLAAGNRSIILSVNLPHRVEKETAKATFLANNLNDQPIGLQGEYKLYPFADYPSRKKAEAPVYSGTFTSNTETALADWKNIPSGVYELVLTAKDEQGREVDFETEVILFSIQDTRPAVETDLWFHSISQTFDASKSAEFILGTSRKDAYILMDAFAGNSRVESRLLHLSDSLVRFTYPYKESYGNGLKLTFCFVQDGQEFMQDVDLTKTPIDNTLKLSWSTFRDKLLPGQQEEWKLTIRDAGGLPVDAELLATMYDASLDQIWKRDQTLKIDYHTSMPYLSWNFYNPSSSRYYFNFRSKYLTVPSMRFDTFLSNGYGYGVMDRVFVGYGAMNKQVLTAGIVEDMAEVQMVAEEMAVDATSRTAKEEAGASAPLPEEETLRTNFAETAFFYPQLRTNEQGDIVISFTMPESLTRWKFTGYAHTQNMFAGMISDEVVTSKEFMLTPNLPRFVRVGDQTSVAASVANLTEKAISGTVVLTLFDPLTEKVITTQKQKFSAEAGKTTAVSFRFTATDKYDLLGCRLMAEGGNFSDGEQHLLPVLSNKERVLETVAMPIRGNETREFSLEKLFNNNSKTATDRKLTVEFSGNPAWYAIQALPSLSLPDNDNAISWATAYYANALAAYIMNTQPRIKAVFDAWKKQGGTKESLLSNLQKNQDVKNILIEESPWLMEASTEQERMERLATLFELNNIRNNNLTALTKLKGLQLFDGSWTWYKGMNGSRYITNYVLQSLIRLQQLTGNDIDQDARSMQEQAFSFLHKEALSEYQSLREAEKRGSKITGISNNALQYLYLTAISGEAIPNANKAAHSYFIQKLKADIITPSITEKAIAAIILQKNGYAIDANAFMASLKEYTTQTDEQGMFFAFNESPYSWMGLKVPAHVTVMEAFDVVSNDRTSVEEMKLWLLKEKQTQQWNSPVATANAVYALLYRGESPVNNQGDVRITFGGKTLETLSPSSASIPGVAYIKESYTDKGTLSKAKKAVVEKRDAGIAWGAVYAEYMEDIDKVTSYGEGLHVDKKLYVERITGNKKELIPITAGSSLSVGDKVVSRITIKLDRTMDFVQLKDQRGACFEPLQTLSGYIWNQGTGYYVAVKDASTNFFFDSLNKGVYVLEYAYRVSRTGTYEGGLATIQSAYAPEYAAHSASWQWTIDN